MAKSTTLDPTNPGWFCQFGQAMARMGDPEKAAALYRKALEIDAHHAPAAAAMAYYLFERGKVDEAEAVIRGPLAAAPDDTELLACAGVLASRRGEFEPAIAHFQNAIRLSPRDPRLHACLGNCFKDIGRLAEAQAAYVEALKLAPQASMTRLNYAIVLLLAGNFVKGLPAFESRPPALAAAAKKNYLRPFWKGERISSLLIWSEQGFGDVIQFSRYIPLVRCAGIRVCLAVQPELIDLMVPLVGAGNVFPRDGTLPECDAQQLIMSIPLIAATRLETIPAAVPYLSADPARLRKFADLLASDHASLKVGIAWSGRPTHTNDAHRSIDPALLAPLSKIPGVSLYSLQVRPKTPAPTELPLRDFTGQFENFADTAALISQLDLVISVDTAVVHLAGALAKPVWTLVPFFPDWRWMLERSDSPWYPTMRLYRQPAFRDWQTPLARVAGDLQQLLQK